MTTNSSKNKEDCSKKPPDDYESFNVNWTSPDDYEIIKKLGRGRYSEVFLAINVKDNNQCVVKTLKPVKPRKVKREIKILQSLNNHANIIKILDMVKDKKSGMASIIFEHFCYEEYEQIMRHITLKELKQFFKQVLQGLVYIHNNKIMHRDIKLSNILYSKQRNALKIIDFGLAEFYVPNTKYNVKVASKNYKAPELLVKYNYYDCSMDMWSFGCIVAAMIFNKNPFFHGTNCCDQLVKILEVLGTKDFQAFLKKYEIDYPHNIFNNCEFENKTPWTSFTTNCNKKLATKDALDFINSILVYDIKLRLTASQALNHKFLKENCEHECAAFMVSEKV